MYLAPHLHPAIAGCLVSRPGLPGCATRTCVSQIAKKTLLDFFFPSIHCFEEENDYVEPKSDRMFRYY